MFHDTSLIATLKAVRALNWKFPDDRQMVGFCWETDRQQGSWRLIDDCFVVLQLRAHWDGLNDVTSLVICICMKIFCGSWSIADSQQSFECTFYSVLANAVENWCNRKVARCDQRRSLCRCSSDTSLFRSLNSYRFLRRKHINYRTDGVSWVEWVAIMRAFCFDLYYKPPEQLGHLGWTSPALHVWEKLYPWQSCQSAYCWPHA